MRQTGKTKQRFPAEKEPTGVPHMEVI